MPPNPIPLRKLTTLSMVQSGEKTISRVIIDSDLHEWVGFGWIRLRRATPDDINTYPKATR